MSTIILCLKILIFSILGFYILKHFKGYHDIYLGVIAPFYGVFCILADFSTTLRLPSVFLNGILGGFILNTIFGFVDERLQLKINILWFGIFNLINTYLLNNIIENILLKSSYQSLTFLFIFGLSFACIDIAISLRKLL